MPSGHTSTGRTIPKTPGSMQSFESNSGSGRPEARDALEIAQRVELAACELRHGRVNEAPNTLHAHHPREQDCNCACGPEKRHAEKPGK